MHLSAKLSQGDLGNLSRILRHNLAAGLSLLEVFQQQSQRGPHRVRPVAGRVADSLRTGATLAAALEKEKSAFPPLFRALAHVGEETGHMPEAFKELEEYYFLEQKLYRQFVSQSILPVVQFFFAIFLIAGLIYVLGKIAEGRPGTKPIAVFGLTGTRGALTFLGFSLGTVTILVAMYVFFKKQFRNLPIVESLLLRIPVLGSCLQAMAMSRLCLALQLTLDSGMTIMQAVRLSLNATGNNAFAVHAEEAAGILKKKKPLWMALQCVRPLPTGFVDLVASSEEGGQVPEMMRHQAAYYQEETSRRMTGVTRLASGLLYMTYAGCMIFAIFSLAQIYLSGLTNPHP